MKIVFTKYLFQFNCDKENSFNRKCENTIFSQLYVKEMVRSPSVVYQPHGDKHKEKQ